MTKQTTIADFLAFDDRLAAKGFPALGAFWRAEAAAYFASGAPAWVAAAGRGSAKSTLLYRLATFEALFGAFNVPAGERHFAVIASRLKDEAAKGIAIIASYLRALDVGHVVVGDTIELADLPRGIKVVASSVAAGSGWRAIFIGVDEASKLGEGGAVTVDAAEVIGSLRAMVATHGTAARHLYCSSAWLAEGVFYGFLQAGCNRLQHVTPPTPTWVASDNRITEAMTRDLEPNERRWLREYACVFGSAFAGGYFDDAIVKPCVASWASRPRVDIERATFHVAIDAAFARDSFAIAIAHRALDGSVVVDKVEALVPRPGAPLEPRACLHRVKQLRAEYGIGYGRVLCDQFAAVPLAALAEEMGLDLEQHAWSATSKANAFGTMSALFRDRRIVVPNDANLLRELAGISVRLLPSGHEQIGARSGYRDDVTMAIALLVARLTTPTPGTSMLNALRASLARGGIEAMKIT